MEKTFGLKSHYSDFVFKYSICCTEGQNLEVCVLLMPNDKMPGISDAICIYVAKDKWFSLYLTNALVSITKIRSTVTGICFTRPQNLLHGPCSLLEVAK